MPCICIILCIYVFILNEIRVYYVDVQELNLIRMSLISGRMQVQQKALGHSSARNQEDVHSPKLGWHLVGKPSREGAVQREQ